MKLVYYTSDKLKREHLILGKPYKVEIEYSSAYVIANELDILTWYEKKHFSDMDSIRRKKLDKLLNILK